jgi:hypothetical protein
LDTTILFLAYAQNVHKRKTMTIIFFIIGIESAKLEKFTTILVYPLPCSHFEKL